MTPLPVYSPLAFMLVEKATASKRAQIAAAVSVFMSLLQYHFFDYAACKRPYCVHSNLVEGGRIGGALSPATAPGASPRLAVVGSRGDRCSQLFDT